MQQFVKTSYNAERIIIQRCSVHCSPVLDFRSKLKYNTNFLSFQIWGSNYYKELKTDWMSDSPCFSYIVDAIGSSGLRHSLTKLRIDYNQTLDQAKVLELINFKENGTHFSCFGKFRSEFWIRRVDDECFN